MIGGPTSWGIVYVDGTLKLTADTSIAGASIYFGPNARLMTCVVPGLGDDACGAGRNLALSSSGPITLAQGIDLTGGNGGGAGAVRPGGSLAISGGDVAIGGPITTTGDNGPSGKVTVAARGTLETADIRAPGAVVDLRGAGGVSVAGDVDVAGSASVPAPTGRLQDGGSVIVASSGGDAAVRGSIAAWGRDSGTAGVGGGAGGGVALSGGDVRVGGVDTSGGGATTAAAGGPGATAIAARGSLDALGRLDASGGGASTGPASAGRTIEARGGGPVVVAGGATVAGGGSQAGGAPAGAIDIAGAAATVGNLSAAGGSGGGGAPSGGGGGGVLTVQSQGRTSVGNLNAGGGSATNGAPAGGGGSVTVAGATVGAGSVTTAGGWASGFTGAPGGPVTLNAEGALTVGGPVTSSGSGAYQNVAPAPAGAPAGRVLLRAANGPLALGGAVRAEGGDAGPHPVDGQRGGAGGAGGPIDVVARTVRQIVAVSSAGGRGGDYGDDQGAGGAGGTIRAWTDAPIFDDQRSVAADGGDGQPAGPGGGRIQESSPTALAIAGSTLSFTGRSPDAQAYRVLRSLAGGPFTAVATRAATGSVAIAAPPCVAARYTVVAVHPPLGWTSDTPPAVDWMAQPSKRQTCAQAPRVTSSKRTIRLRVASLRRAKWTVRVRVRSSGMGGLQARLLSRRRTVTTVRTSLPRAGAATVKLTLPRIARRAGRYSLRLRATAPLGSKATTTTITLEVRR